MALSNSARRLLCSGSTIRQVTRVVHNQSNFIGLRALAIYDSNHGFGYNGQGELVVVGPSKKGNNATGHSYSLLGKPEILQPLEALPEPPVKLIRDRDLWIEGLANIRGGTPWTRPLAPRRGPYCAGAASFSSVAGDGYSPASKSDIPTSLVIFDKDGTLIDCNSVWIPWMNEHIDQLEEKTGMSLSKKLYDAVGYCPKKKEYQDDGLLAHATVADIKNKMEEVLVDCGLDAEEAHDMVEGCCADFDTGNDEMLEPLGDLTNIFRTLKSKDVKIAVCTMDSRNGTMSALDRLGLTSLVDKIVCGDDKASKPKPAPDNALNICKALDICPSKTVVIGDTTADTGMGRSAGLGLTVGVLTGAGSRSALEKDSDIVLNSVDELLDVVFDSTLYK